MHRGDVYTVNIGYINWIQKPMQRKPVRIKKKGKVGKIKCDN